MNQEDILKNYILSQYSMEKLAVIKEKLRENIIQADPIWQILNQKKKEVTDEESIEEASNNSNEDCNDILSKRPHQLQSTQFYFTQEDKSFNISTQQEHISKLDITECVFEELECPNGKLDWNQLENLTETECLEIVCDLEKRLNIIGTYNLCCSMNNMTLNQRIKYVQIFYTHLVLPKIIALKEPSRLLLSVLVESTQKFPNDIQQFIFIPLLNVDLTDTTIIDAVVNTFEPERRIILIAKYLSYVKELKSWHLSFLHTLITTTTDTTLNNKLIQLLSEKAIDFAKDKSFGKLVLSFIKSSIKFSNEQKELLWEIANINQTLYKKPMQNILKSM
ncbi:hypothetical protein WN51_08555 [Melipona quadrifasciata]|uniref:Uncharacterized protein n=1 Tax=Melipona quadrifasciata TaxID=166423 RepID=A0A0M9A8S8_9HYME|nr:hypothetical protein WN51_08555 [Melipona quadrifasciata]